MAKNPVLIVHGWNDNYKSFIPLKQWLENNGYLTQDVFFGNYESMEDNVTFDDLADGLQTRFKEMIGKQQLPPLNPFSLDVIVHSTGGLVIRHWLHHYLVDECKGDLNRCPIQRLIMLAPANFGSRLAAQGKSGLAKLFKGGMAHGFETGRLILEGLELGSPITWQIAEQDLFSQRKIYRSVKNQGPYVFIFSGTHTYGELKGFVAPGANEDGSDGTVRASAACLNSIRISADYEDTGNPRAKADIGNYEPFAFALVPGKNHTEIVPSDPADGAHPSVQRILQCLNVNSDAQYETLRNEFEHDNGTFYANEAKKPDDERVHKFQQFLVRIRDDMGNDVYDYQLDFHVVDATIATSVWDVRDKSTFAPLKQYQDLTQFLQDNVIAHIYKHSVNQAYRTFFINLDKLNELKSKFPAGNAKPLIGMNVDAMGPTNDLAYDTDKLRYMPVEIPIPDGRGGSLDFFKANTSTMVEITLQRVPSLKIVDIVW